MEELILDALQKALVSYQLNDSDLTSMRRWHIQESKLTDLAKTITKLIQTRPLYGNIL